MTNISTSVTTFVNDMKKPIQDFNFLFQNILNENQPRKKIIQAISQSTPRQSIPWQLAIHLKEKLHECGFCHKRFSLKQSVQKHIAAIHFKEKHHEWEFCQGRFSHKYSLQKHMMAIHLKEKLHECVICQEKLSWPHTTAALPVHHYKVMR